MTKKLPTKHLVDLAAHDLLVLVKANIKPLLKDPNSLAYILWKWDRLAHSGRFLEYPKNMPAYLYEIEGSGTCEENPKYALELVLKDLNEKDCDMVYAAWAVSVSNEGYGKDTWINFYTDNNVFKGEIPEQPPCYTSIYNKIKKYFVTDFSIRDHIFCTIGNGLRVFEGNISDRFNPNNNFDKYYTKKDSLPVEVADKFFEIINRPECVKSINKAKKQTTLNSDEIDVESLKNEIYIASLKHKIPFNLKEIETKKDFIKAIEKTIEIAKLEMEDEYCKNTLIGTLLALREECLNDRSGYLVACTNEKWLDSFRARANIFKNITSLTEEEMAPQEYKEKHSFLFTKPPEVHYPACIEYSLIFKYKELNDDYKEALIQTAKELINCDNQTAEVKDECKKLLEYYGITTP